MYSKLTIALTKQTKRSYEIIIGDGAIQTLPGDLKKHSWGMKYAIITDDFVKKTHGTAIKKLFEENDIPYHLFSIPSGEHSKNAETLMDLADKLLKQKFTRDDAVIGIGGGVVGDLGGFLASIYLRGVAFIQVPTTLLAMVDSSIGGKTGIDMAAGKNLIGTFHQPKKVYMDTNFLKTLPLTQIQNGLGEIIKCAIIRDAKFFTYIEQNAEKILARDPTVLNKIIIQSCSIKKRIVENDENESGERMLVNYGHTYGHALEKASHYSIPHGFAISVGMIIANTIAEQETGLPHKDSLRIKNLLKKVGLPYEIDKKYSMKHLKEMTKNDKKVRNGMLHMILPIKIGKAVIVPIHT